jgi:ABC-type branched-subunit amino acid transport system ATPase component
MAVIRPRYSKEEFARRGDEIYERDINSRVGPDDEGKFVVIDIETGAYEVDRDEIVASDRLLARYPDAQVWLRQVGSRYAHRFGPRNKAVKR